MQVIARHEFETASRFPAYFSADPIFHKGVLYYPYGINPVWCRKIGVDGTMEESCHAFPKEVPLALPYQWRLFLYKDHVLLSCGRSGGVFLDLDADMKEVALAPELAQRFLCRRPTDETAEAALSGCTMRYKNSRRYQCVSPGGKVLWEEKHRGYRYTPFEERKDCVFFGTAGAGGGIYGYRLADGACLCALDTKGTARYCWQKERIVCRSREGTLLWVDPFAGAVTAELDLGCLLNDDSGLWADERYVCAVGFAKKTAAPCVCLVDTRSAE